MNNWQCHPPHGMGYGMQYAPSPVWHITWNTCEQVSISADYFLMKKCMSLFFIIYFYQNVAAFPSSAKSRNPFDVEDDPRTIQSAMVCAPTTFIYFDSH